MDREGSRVEIVVSFLFASFSFLARKSYPQSLQFRFFTQHKESKGYWREFLKGAGISLSRNPVFEELATGIADHLFFRPAHEGAESPGIHLCPLCQSLPL